MDQDKNSQIPAKPPANTYPNTSTPATEADPAAAFPKRAYHVPWSKIAALGIAVELIAGALCMCMLYLLFVGKLGIETTNLTLVSIYILSGMIAWAGIYASLKQWAVDYPFIIALLTLAFANIVYRTLIQHDIALFSMGSPLGEAGTIVAYLLIGPTLLLLLTFLTNKLPGRKLVMSLLTALAIGATIVIYT
jgi:hypothetical protein